MRIFSTAHDLYISGEFRGLRERLMMERVDDKGNLCCEHCGRPILQSHDCIAHHKIEVTAGNLNDYEITLNPSNIALVHHSCHNEIHDRFGWYSRKVYFIWGSPCSGKNSYVSSVMGSNDLLVDMDALWQAITGREKYFKPEALKKNVFLLQSSLFDQIKTGAGGWRSAYILSTETREATRARICRELGAEQIYIPVTKEKALIRLAGDPERSKYVPQWTEYINKFFEEMEGQSYE